MNLLRRKEKFEIYGFRNVEDYNLYMRKMYIDTVLSVTPTKHIFDRY